MYFELNFYFLGGSPRKLAVIEQSKKDIKERVMYFRVVSVFYFYINIYKYL